MKKIKKIVALALFVAMMMPFAVSAVSSSSYGSKVTMYAPDGRTVSVSVYEVEKWKSVGWYDYPVTTMYAPDGRQAVVYTKEVPKWKSVGWYDYPVAIMYAPDGRQAVVYVGEVEKWKAVGWYDQPVSSAKSRTNSSSYYPNTTIPSYEPYGRFEYQSFSDDGETLYWGYYTSAKDANKYLSVLYDSGFEVVFSDDLEFIEYASLYKRSSDESVYIIYDHGDNIILIGYNI